VKKGILINPSQRKRKKSILMKHLSAIGSRTFPRFVFCFNKRARLPSKVSLKAPLKINRESHLGEKSRIQRIGIIRESKSL